MEKKIVTISRQFGSGGRSIGKAVAETLGVPYCDKKLIRQVAGRTGLDTRYIKGQGEYAAGRSTTNTLPGGNGERAPTIT